MAPKKSSTWDETMKKLDAEKARIRSERLRREAGLAPVPEVTESREDATRPKTVPGSREAAAKPPKPSKREPEATYVDPVANGRRHKSGSFKHQRIEENKPPEDPDRVPFYRDMIRSPDPDALSGPRERRPEDMAPPPLPPTRSPSTGQLASRTESAFAPPGQESAPGLPWLGGVILPLEPALQEARDEPAAQEQVANEEGRAQQDAGEESSAALPAEPADRGGNSPFQQSAQSAQSSPPAASNRVSESNASDTIVVASQRSRTRAGTMAAGRSDAAAQSPSPPVVPRSPAARPPRYAPRVRYPTPPRPMTTAQPAQPRRDANGQTAAEAVEEAFGAGHPHAQTFQRITDFQLRGLGVVRADEHTVTVSFDRELYTITRDAHRRIQTDLLAGRAEAESQRRQEAGDAPNLRHQLRNATPAQRAGRRRVREMLSDTTVVGNGELEGGESEADDVDIEKPPQSESDSEGDIALPPAKRHRRR